MSELSVMIALVSLLLACFGALKIKSFMSWRDTFLGIGAIFIGFVIVYFGDSTMFTGVMIEMFIIASMTLVAFRLIHMRWGMENHDSVRYYRITMNRKQKIILAIVLVTLIGGLFGLSYWIKHNRNIKTQETNLRSCPTPPNSNPSTREWRRIIASFMPAIKKSSIFLITAVAWFFWAFHSVRGASI